MSRSVFVTVSSPSTNMAVWPVENRELWSDYRSPWLKITKNGEDPSRGSLWWPLRNLEASNNVGKSYFESPSPYSRFRRNLEAAASPSQSPGKVVQFFFKKYYNRRRKSHPPSECLLCFMCGSLSNKSQHTKLACRCGPTWSRQTSHGERRSSQNTHSLKPRLPFTNPPGNRLNAPVRLCARY